MSWSDIPSSISYEPQLGPTGAHFGILLGMKHKQTKPVWEVGVGGTGLPHMGGESTVLTNGDKQRNVKLYSNVASLHSTYEVIPRVRNGSIFTTMAISLTRGLFIFQLPQIGHFLFLTAEVLNIGEVMQFELERSFWMPRRSAVMQAMMTSLLSTPYQRTRSVTYTVNAIFVYNVL